MTWPQRFNEGGYRWVGCVSSEQWVVVGVWVRGGEGGEGGKWVGLYESIYVEIWVQVIG